MKKTIGDPDSVLSVCDNIGEVYDFGLRCFSWPSWLTLSQLVRVAFLFTLFVGSLDASAFTQHPHRT